MLFLRALGSRSKHAGQKVDVIPAFDFPLAWCANTEELEFVIRSLIEQKYVQLLKHADPADSFYLELVVTSQGWSQLDAADTLLEASKPMTLTRPSSNPADLVFSERVTPEPEHSWDAFISHASEDKADIARPLADALTVAGLRIWYDDFTLSIGDSLRRSIDRGLVKSRFGIVILSNAFFQKHWPQAELDGLTAREGVGTKVILPIWHGLDASAVRQYSPILADKIAVSSSIGLDRVVNQLLRVIRPSV